MTRNEGVIIDLALQILKDAEQKASAGPVDTIAVRLALRCLLPHCPERWPLTSFWSAASQHGTEHYNHVARGQCCSGALNGICRQLGRARYSKEK